MADTTNPRAALDAALEERLRIAATNAASLAKAATASCEEVLSLLVDAHRPTPPEPDPRESLPDDTPVGHRWVMGRNGQELFRQRGNGYFTWWFRGARKWGAPGGWSQSGLGDTRPATVGDLRRVELPVTEWPDITAPESEPSRAERAEAERDNAITALRAIRNKLSNLAAGHVEGSDDAGGAYWESLYVVKTEARRRGIDLGEEAP